MFLRHFLHSSLVNLLLLASLEERSIYRVLNYFLEVRNEDDLEEELLTDEVTGDGFVLFWEAVTVLEVEAFPCFQE